MAVKEIRIPSADHPITIEPYKGRVIVKSDGRIIADSRATLVLREASYPPVHYIPRKDVNMTLLERTAHATYCPYKGDASYFSVPLLGAGAANAVWTYEKPYEAVAPIESHLAFYPDRVEITEE
ncbi:DUF427 domain-containing protein [Flaviflagellibacter deserti]|uniref:DUF427 domain-containing protein n=1 Tax=Flaviflagellibacter deserti TaxID=2267266 RepID=A0ABV9Z3W9_9HYPH